jgi:predicted transcriptional regulator
MEIKERILSILPNEPLPIYQVAKKVNLTVQTTSKYLHILQAEQKAKMTRFGNMKLVSRW